MISSTGVWSDEEAQYHIQSEQLLSHLVNILNSDKIVYDFGCGNGFYINELKKIGFNRCIGIEGSKIKNALSNNIFIHDLSKNINFENKGQVLSFEVGEHIPEQYEDIFLNNLLNNCDSQLIISWAIPDQGGIGHVNCKSNEYIINKISNKGFDYNNILTNEIRQGNYENTPWFYNTLMIFDKIKNE